MRFLVRSLLLSNVFVYSSNTLYSTWKFPKNAQNGSIINEITGLGRANRSNEPSIVKPWISQDVRAQSPNVGIRFGFGLLLHLYEWRIFNPVISASFSIPYAKPARAKQLPAWYWNQKDSKIKPSMKSFIMLSLTNIHWILQVSQVNYRLECLAWRPRSHFRPGAFTESFNKPDN